MKIDIPEPLTSFRNIRNITSKDLDHANTLTRRINLVRLTFRQLKAQEDSLRKQSKKEKEEKGKPLEKQ